MSGVVLVCAVPRPGLFHWASQWVKREEGVKKEGKQK